MSLGPGWWFSHESNPGACQHSGRRLTTALLPVDSAAVTELGLATLQPPTARPRIEAGRIRVTIGQRFPLAEAAEAHRALESSRTRDGTVLSP